jgi:hypothetical protein
MRRASIPPIGVGTINTSPDVSAIVCLQDCATLPLPAELLRAY